MIDLGEIVLRAMEPEDVESLYCFRNDWNVIRHLGGFSYGYSKKNLRDWIEFHRNRDDEVLWAIAVKETNLCIGHVALYRVDTRLRKAEFGIVIGDKAWWGRGIGRKVTYAALAWGFDQLHLHKIELSVLATNPRAIHLYEQLGFSHEGRLRDDQFRDGAYVDTVLMSLLESEWTQAKGVASSDVK